MQKDLAKVDYRYIESVEPGSALHFLAGACPLDADGAVCDPGNFAAQARRCLENAEAVLANSGLTLTSICFLRVLVASSDRADLVTAWHALVALLPDMPPATLQGVTVLGYPDQLVELEIVARSK
jgi:enamine deaminase RidA (YjgF/YER057c/UK114 family)